MQSQTFHKLLQILKNLWRSSNTITRKRLQGWQSHNTVKDVYRTHISTDVWSLSPKDRQRELTKILNVPLRNEKKKIADFGGMDILKKQISQQPSRGDEKKSEKNSRGEHQTRFQRLQIQDSSQ